MSDTSSRRIPARQIAFIGTYLPRRCGIATFTTDLAEAVSAAASGTDVLAVAMNDRPEGYHYPQRVQFEIPDNRPSSYRLAAEFLNMNQIDAVCLQHEYGIFGGPDGRHVLDLVRRLHMPVVATLHTVLKDPTPGQQETLMRLADLSDRLVVLAERAAEFLTDLYRVPPEKVVHIPHGIPDVPFVDPNYYKDQFGVEGKKVILTSGLLNPGKGIETLIDAMPAVLKAHPEAVYVVLGATHPRVQATTSEDYRLSLQRRAEQRGVGDHVMFHNRFVKLQKLCEFLGAADLYVTPYLNEAQCVSGTLAYAMGTGNAVVSTPYWYAQEMLARNRGRLVPFRDPEALAAAIVELFDNDVARHAVSKRAYKFTRKMTWNRVAKQYLRLFFQVLDERRRSPKPLFSEGPAFESSPELPPVKLDHLRTLTDDTGILQHARGVVPWREHGYCTDDSARALVTALWARQHLPGGAGCTALVNHYLSFLDHAFNAEAGRFRNFLTYDRRWTETVGSEDSHARAVWALGELAARSEMPGHLTPTVILFRRAAPAMENFASPRAWAYGLIGIHAYLKRFGGETHMRRLRDNLAGKLMTLYERNATDDWPWPENILAYDNARLPQALLLAGQSMSNEKMLETALGSLEWLLEAETAREGHFSPVGNRGWFPKGGKRARFDQQPVETCATVEACVAACRATEDPLWLVRAKRCFDWFLGDNDLGVPVLDRRSGGCCDGLQSKGVNENQGAESTLSCLLALLTLHSLRAGEFTDDQEPSEAAAAFRGATAWRSRGEPPEPSKTGSAL